MSDRTAAEIFGNVFRILAEKPTDESKALAGKVFALIDNYDFTEDQMYVDRELKRLGLARVVQDPDDASGRTVLKYGPERKQRTPTGTPSST